MSNFIKLKSGIDVSGIVSQLDAHPELWNANDERTREASPHYAIPDIWVRFRAHGELTTPGAFREPHFAEFYPAWHALPALEPIVFDIMASVRPRAVYLGGILITKIPPGGAVKPHNDRGGWHAEFHNTKVYVALKSNPRCVNYCDGDSVVMEPGDAVIFNNLLEHSVENNGVSDRVTLIICLRTEP